MSKLVDTVYLTLVQDATFMALLDLTPTSPPEQVVKRLVKGIESQQAISSERVPMLFLYTKPGRFSPNSLVYEGKFAIEILAKTPKEAENLAERIFQLLHDQTLEGKGFRSPRCVLAYEGIVATGITGVSGYEVQYDANYIRMNGGGGVDA